MLETTLPAINACFNLLSALLLTNGYVAIRKRRIVWHVRSMLAAVASSSLFLVGYLTRVALGGTHRFPGEGALKWVYLSLLFSHMVLAVALLPLLGRTLWLAYQRRFDTHRFGARITWPIWMYVSVTGVIVYVMLYRIAPRLMAHVG